MTEAIIAVVLVGIALSVLVVIFQKKAAARETLHKLGQIGLATHKFHDVFNQFPPAFGRVGESPAGDASFFYHLLPFLEEDGLYRNFDGAAMVSAYLSPEDTSGEFGGVGTYAANIRVFSAVGLTKGLGEFRAEPGETFDGKSRFKDMSDGTSNIIFFVTKYGVCREGGSKWASKPLDKTSAFFGFAESTQQANASSPKATFQLAPNEEECVWSPPMAQSFTVEGLRVCIGDGSTRTLTPQISAMIWNYALCPNDGNPLQADDTD